MKLHRDYEVIVNYTNHIAKVLGFLTFCQRTQSQDPYYVLHIIALLDLLELTFLLIPI